MDTTVMLMAVGQIEIVVAGGWVCGVHYTVLRPSNPILPC